MHPAPSRGRNRSITICVLSKNFAGAEKSPYIKRVFLEGKRRDRSFLEYILASLFRLRLVDELDSVGSKRGSGLLLAVAS
jgi:hypothetical protein